MSTHIEWTDQTWNVVTGCTKVSAGCEHCYIERTPPFRMEHRRFDKPGIGGTTGVRLHPDRLDKPLHWRKPRKVFVNSLSDLFHDDVPDELIARAFVVMAMAKQHTFQLLTKRHARMRALLGSREFQVLAGQAAFHLMQAEKRPVGWDWPLPNVWLGVSVENQQWADIRIPALLDTPAAVRFLSCEPLLGPINFRWARWQPFNEDPNVGTNELDGLRRLDWVIVGGESGQGARPMHPAWARSIRDQCVAGGVPFLFKQWGEWAPFPIHQGAEKHNFVMSAETGEGTYYSQRDQPGNAELWRVGTKAAGRELDGRTWDEYPA